MHSDNTLLANARALAKDWDFGPRSVIYSFSPLSHNLGFGAMVAAFAAGGELVVHDVPRGSSLGDRLIETGHIPVRGADACDRPARRDAVTRLAAAWRGQGLPHLRRRNAERGHCRTAAPWRNAAERLRHDRDMLAPYTLPTDDPDVIAETCGRSCAGYEIRIWDQAIPISSCRSARSARSAGAAQA